MVLPSKNFKVVIILYVYLQTDDNKENRNVKKGRAPKEVSKEVLKRDEKKQEDRKRRQKLYDAKLMTEVPLLLTVTCMVYAHIQQFYN